MATDEELIGAVADGDGRALEQLCRRYERGLHQFIFRHTGGRDVDDLYQETWLRVVRAAGRFDRRRRFSTWLFQIAVNLCRDWHRRPPASRTPRATEPHVATPRSTLAGCSTRSPRRSEASSSSATTTTSTRARSPRSSAVRVEP